MNKSYKLSALAAVIAATTVTTVMANDSATGPFGFSPIAESANATDWNPESPWIIPEGFSQSIVSDESDLNIYGAGHDDWNDMNTVNETGRQAGRYLYRTHEVRNHPEGGAVSVVDLKTGEASILT